MLSPFPETDDVAVRARPAELQFLVVGDDLRDVVAAALEERDGHTLETAASLDAAREHVADADCLVVPAALLDDPAGDGEAPLEPRRAILPDLPTVVLVDGPSDPIAAPVRDRRLTAVLDRNALGRLPARARDLVERRRLAALSRRSLASVEFAGEAIAIVTPGDEIQFASRSLAVRFGYDHGTLPGTDWRALFPTATVERLESTAIPTVADGWRWTGGCTARRRNGETFPARLGLSGLEDGSLVFVVENSDDGDRGT